MAGLVTVAESVSFPSEEERTLQIWQELNAFQTCQQRSKGKPIFSFYDGPPFATGLPHYGHILAGTIKDVVTRFAYQSGYHVERRFGWDCHGLPVEYEIDKKFGFASPQDIEKFGVANYNNECRKIVMRYSNEWKAIVQRLGRWIDFDNDYKTLYPEFMESVWWVFKQLFDKGLVYKGVKVMPFSTACGTPLSNFESGQNYKDVVDPSVFVSFPLVSDPKVLLVAWTTTPWTLPSNFSLCVNPDMQYVKVRDKGQSKIFVLLEARLSALYKSDEEYEILEKFAGKKLQGLHYQPLFDYFASVAKERNAFRVLCDTYVTAESGTGIVQQAPYFGEDDYRVCLENGLINRSMTPICPVDSAGRYTSEVKDFKGQYVKDVDKEIIKLLKIKERLVHQSSIKHSYPFCWRSDTPLIYKAVPSWFVRVECLVDKLLENNGKTYWVPEFVKEKRFANWLRDARDWAISRNRFWGTPIPLWVSDDGQEVVCVGSLAELERLSGVKVTDLHREHVDSLTIASSRGKGHLRRVPEVFDCWFESGSMPYAQVHYPFENCREFKETFPAHFIAEGIDQTRGWFYTLLVISTALFGKPPFLNLIVNGLILAADGSKMSKRKKNYPDPMEVIHKYGADALRLYLIDSPVVRGEFLKFREEGVKDILKDVFLPWYNAYRFLVQNVQHFQKRTGQCFQAKLLRPDNVMDRWIMSFTHSLVAFVHMEMKAYRLYTVVPRLVRYVNLLTNWYVRMNRKRIKGELGEQECLNSLETLSHVLIIITRLMAPFTPFIVEMMWRNLSALLGDTDDAFVKSVHFLSLPQQDVSLIDPEVEKRVQTMQCVVEIARVIRDRKTLPVKYPLKSMVVVHPDKHLLDQVTMMQSYILDELNVRQLAVSSDRARWGVHAYLEPNYRALGERLKKDLTKVSAALKSLAEEQVLQFSSNGFVEICGHRIDSHEATVKYTLSGQGQLKEAHEAHSDGHIIVMLNLTQEDDMQEEGVAREIINRVQKLRKKAKLMPQDDVSVYCHVSDSSTEDYLKKWQSYLQSCLRQPVVFHLPSGAEIASEKINLQSYNFDVKIFRPTNVSGGVGGAQPFCPYVDVSTAGREGSVRILLENPVGSGPLTLWQLWHKVQSAFGLWHQALPQLYLDSALKQPLTHQLSVLSLAGREVYVTCSNVPLNHVGWTNVTANNGCRFSVPTDSQSTVAQLLSQIANLLNVQVDQLKLSDGAGELSITDKLSSDTLTVSVGLRNS